LKTKQSKKYLGELREKNTEALSIELVNAKKELFNLRFQNATNQLDNTARIREVRKNIARILTIITQEKNKDLPQTKKLSRKKRMDEKLRLEKKLANEKKLENKRAAKKIKLEKVAAK